MITQDDIGGKMPELKARVSESDDHQLVAVVRRAGRLECIIGGPEELVLSGLFKLGLSVEAIQGMPERLLQAAAMRRADKGGVA